MTEQELLDAVVDLAHVGGWLVHHQRPAMNRRGQWASHVQGDPGFPDLVLAHPTRGVIFAELKSEKGRLSTAQNAWLDVLDCNPVTHYPIAVYVWRPSDWESIVQTLTPGAKVA